MKLINDLELLIEGVLLFFGKYFKLDFSKKDSIF